MKRIGLLTFSYSSNPGSVLQAYALQQTLSEKLSCDVHIINYQKQQAGKPIIGQTVFMRPLRNWTPKNIAKWIARIIEHPIRMKPYKKFFNTYYKGYPEKRCLRQNLPLLENKYDKFIVGSDQVWNFDSWNVDETYFLDFVKDSSKKISYAASMGKSEIPSEKQEIAKKLLSEFSHISVREAVSVETIANLTGREATLVLDPSLLLSKDKYLELAETPKQNNYVLLYLRENSPELEEKARAFADSQGLAFIKIFKHWKCSAAGKAAKGLSPQQWLGYINNADYVITNSFHGICFSIIFEKQFYVDVLKKVSVSTNPRMQCILDMFGLQARKFDCTGNLCETDPIDYIKVNKIKKEMIEKSLKYLEDSIKAE